MVAYYVIVRHDRFDLILADIFIDFWSNIASAVRLVDHSKYRLVDHTQCSRCYLLLPLFALYHGAPRNRETQVRQVDYGTP